MLSHTPSLSILTFPHDRSYQIALAMPPCRTVTSNKAMAARLAVYISRHPSSSEVMLVLLAGFRAD